MGWESGLVRAWCASGLARPGVWDVSVVAGLTDKGVGGLPGCACVWASVWVVVWVVVWGRACLTRQSDGWRGGVAEVGGRLAAQAVGAVT